MKTILSALRFCFLLTAVLLALGTTSAYAATGPGDWSYVRLYGHAYDITNGTASGWNNNQLNIIQNNCLLYTTEKRHAKDYYGTPVCTEQAASYCSRVHYNRNNNIQVLFYWNSILPFEDVFETVEYMYTHNYNYFETQFSTNWTGDFQWKWSNTNCANFWVELANSYVDAPNTEARIAGVFVDACPKIDSITGANSYYKTKLFAAMDKLHGLVIYNGYRVVGTDVQAGTDFLAHADGVYVEAFLDPEVTEEPAERLLQIDSLLAVPTNKYIVCRGYSTNAVGSTAYNDDFEDALAAYLIVANSKSFFRWGKDYDGEWIDDIPNHPEYGYAVGAPNEDARWASGRYVRQFKHCTAYWFPDNVRASRIAWNQNN